MATLEPKWAVLPVTRLDSGGQLFNVGWLENGQFLELDMTPTYSRENAQKVADMMNKGSGDPKTAVN